MTVEEFREETAPLSPLERDTVSGAVWLTFRAGSGWLFMLAMKGFFEISGWQGTALKVALFILGMIVAHFASKAFRVVRLGILILRNGLIGPKAPAWALAEGKFVKTGNWFYLKARLSKRHFETARALAAGFTGSVGELIMVTRGLD